MTILSLSLSLLEALRGAAPDVSPISSAENCGRCHRAIHAAWKSSSHATAMESRLFQDALEMAESDFGAGARKTCLGCHAPMAVSSGDLGLMRKVSWEGVTCDYCHSIRAVTLTGPNPRANVLFSSVKTGPFPDSVSNGHETQFSALHTSSAVCAPCHEYRNAAGFPVLTTFSEWQGSRYAKEGKQCQSCHMARVAGDVVDPHVSRSAHVKINLHQMPGSHSLDQLTSAVRAQLNAVRDGGNLRVSVELTNRTAGHSFPTGSPLRQLVLEVRADSGAGQHFREERIYARQVADQAGKPVTREHVAFLKAAKLLSDTRLAAGESRTESFTFAIPPGTFTNVKATLLYTYSPMAGKESQRIPFLTLSRPVR